MTDDNRVACLKRDDNFGLTCIRAMPQEPAKWCVECCERRFVVAPGPITCNCSGVGLHALACPVYRAARELVRSGRMTAPAADSEPEPVGPSLPPPGVPDGSEVDVVQEIVRQRALTYDPEAKPSGDCFRQCGRAAKHVYGSNSGRFSVSVCDECRHEVCPHTDTILLPNYARICKECNTPMVFPSGSILPIGDEMLTEAVTGAEVEQAADQMERTGSLAPAPMMIKGGALTPEAIKRIESEIKKMGSAWPPIIMESEPAVPRALLKRYMQYVDEVDGTSLVDEEIQGENWPIFSDEEWALLMEIRNEE